MAETVALVTLCWGVEVVAVRTVRDGESTSLAGGTGGLAAVPELLPHADGCAVRVWHGGLTVVTVPAGAVVRVEEADGSRRRAVGPCALQLGRGARVSVALGSSSGGCDTALVLEVEVLACEPDRFARAPRLFGGAAAHVLATALVHAALLIASPVFGTTADDGERERIVAMQRALARSEERSDDATTDATDASPHPRLSTGAAKATASERRRNGSDPPVAPAAPPAAAAWRGSDPFDSAAVSIPSAPEVEAATPPAPARRPAAAVHTQQAPPASREQLGLVERVMHQSAPRFRACAEAARARGHVGHGQVVPELVIDAGKVAAVRGAGSTVDDAELEECVLDALSRLTFPVLPEEGPFAVRYPLAFSAARP
jgi:hypothetical protein